MRSCNHHLCLNCAKSHVLKLSYSATDLFTIKIACPISKCPGIFSKDELLHLQKPNENAPSNVVENEYVNLMNIEDNVNAVLNTDPFDCPICLMSQETGDGIVLRNCFHVICKECFCNYVLSSNDVVLTCPIIDESMRCIEIIEQREIKAILLPDKYEIYLKKNLSLSAQQMPNTFHCLTVNCTGFWITERGDKEFICNVCKVANCIECKVFASFQ